MKNMEQLQFLVNAQGERTGLLLDFASLKKQSQQDLEDLEDIIVCELRKNSPRISWEKAKQMLQSKDVID